MSTDRDTTRIVRSWLDEGVTQLPDRVLDAVLDEVPATRQRRGTWWAVPGPARMTTMLEYGVAAAAMVAVVLIGVTTFGTPTVGGPGLEPTPTAEASIPEPTATAEPSRTPTGFLPEGRFVLSDGRLSDRLTGVPITVTIPAPGWYGEPGGGILGNVPEEQDFGPEDAWMIGPFVGEIHVPADPCRWSTTMPDTPATSVDEVVGALRSQASRDASEPVDIMVDGHAGKSITLRVPDDADFGECDRNPLSGDAEFCTLAESKSAVCHRYHQFPGQIDELWILEVNGEVAVIDATWSDATPPRALDELQAILDSITFE